VGMLLLCFSQSMLRCGSFPSPPFERLVLVLVRMCALVCVCVCVRVRACACACVRACVPVTALNLRSCDGTALKLGSFKQGVLALLAILLHSELYVSRLIDSF
jgi:hypothetical protein